MLEELKTVPLWSTGLWERKRTGHDQELQKPLTCAKSARQPFLPFLYAGVSAEWYIKNGVSIAILSILLLYGRVL